MSRKTSTSQITHNTQDIGYVLGKMEMLEKQMKVHQAHADKQMIEVIEKLDKCSTSMSFWKHWVFIIKTLLLTAPLVAAGNWDAIIDLWKD